MDEVEEEAEEGAEGEEGNRRKGNLILIIKL